MQLQYAYGLNLQFKRNPNNGYFYFTSTKSDTPDVAVVGGQAITHTAFIACFNDLGQFQWVREDTATSPGRIFLYNLDFDSDNNIYLGGRMTGFGLETFLGFTIPDPIVTGFIMKVNPTATSLFWSSYNNKDALERGAIIVNGNEIGYAGYCYGTDFTWGSQVLNANAGGTGTEVLLARFNKTTGACIGLSKIPGNVGYDDAGTALAVDSSGDYILGGGCGGQMTFATNSITTIGPQGDFFVAKYATSPCSLGTEEFFDEGLLLYPNPAETFVSIITGEKLSYVIYNVTGSVILQGIVTSENNSIDISALAAGCYVISTKDENGGVKRGKLVKR